jgi:hypothetical protein
LVSICGNMEYYMMIRVPEGTGLNNVRLSLNCTAKPETNSLKLSYSKPAYWVSPTVLHTAYCIPNIGAS